MDSRVRPAPRRTALSLYNIGEPLTHPKIRGGKKARRRLRPAPPAAVRPAGKAAWLLPPALVVLFSLFAWSQRGVYEDGFFFLRVVDVFLHSGDLSYNPGERYETNTDFLWTFLLIPGPAAGLDDILWMHIVGVSVFAAALGLTFILARGLLSSAEAGLVAIVLLGGHYSFANFAVTGFGAALQALAAVCCLLALLRFGEFPNSRNGAILGFALLFLAMCRLDSAVLGLPLVLCAAYFARRAGKPAAAGILLALGIPSILFGGVLLWKLSYYGDIFPATYYVKGSTDQAGRDMTAVFIKNGARFMALYWKRYFLWLLAGAAALGAWRILKSAGRKPAGESSRAAVLWTTAAMCVLWHGYMLRIGGDNYEFRMLVPQAPLLMILLAAGLRGLARHWRWAAACGAALFSILHWQTAADAVIDHEATVRGGGRPEFKAPPGNIANSRLFALALRDLFGHLGKYPPEVRVAHVTGGLAAYLAPLLWTEMIGYADPRIGRAKPKDLIIMSENIGHFQIARPELLHRLGVNLVIGHARFVPDPDFSRPIYRHENPRLTWAAAVSQDFNITDATFPPDSQLFLLPTPGGRAAPVLYINRNETIDRILDERGIERVDVFP